MYITNWAALYQEYIHAYVCLAVEALDPSRFAIQTVKGDACPDPGVEKAEVRVVEEKRSSRCAQCVADGADQ